MATRITLNDMGGDPAEVARGLVAWQRGEPDEAVLQTLRSSCGEMNRASYTLWVWQGRTEDGEAAWVLPITATQAATFTPRGSAAALIRCLRAAAALDADPGELRLEEWRGMTCLVVPGIDPELSAVALEEAHPAARAARVADLPPEIVMGGGEIPLVADPGARGPGIAALGRALHLHPVTAYLALLLSGLPDQDMPDDPADLARSLRDLGWAGEPPPAGDDAPSLAIDDDPSSRRRHARRVLRRLLQKGKIGGHHTEIGHFTRGLPDHEKRDAKEVVEELLRAGLLVEKPSVGQRHISLNRESLPEIHALISRGETSDPQLAEIWGAPAPGR